MMGGPYVLQLHSEAEPSVHLIGPKAFGIFKLMKLTYLGFKIPDGFVITTNAYNEIYTRERNKIESVLEGRSRGYDKTAELIQKHLTAPKLFPYRFLLDVEPAYEKLCNNIGVENVAVAVRSSAIFEDTKSKSYAGVYESFLNVKGVKSLKVNVFRCFASAWKKHLLLERIKKNNIPKNASIALIVQKMICSEISGVTFTADPLSGDTAKLSINSAWGLGNAIVTGKVNSDIFIFNKRTMDFSTIRLGNKEQASSCSIIEGTEIKKIPNELAKKPSLTHQQAHKLIKICMNIEHKFGYPVDIEWAIHNNEIYIFQVRPITTM